MIPNRVCPHSDDTAGCDCFSRELWHPVDRGSQTAVGVHPVRNPQMDSGREYIAVSVYTDRNSPISVNWS